MRRPLVVGDLEVKPGEIGFGRLECSTLRDGQAVSIPIIAMNGAEDGPVMWIQAAIHGVEIPGFEVIRRLLREELDPKRLRGAIKAAPIANPYAFQGGAIFAPQDEVDAHVEFPGDRRGSVSQRLAHLLYTEGLSKCDYFIDLHSNDRPAVNFLPVPSCDNDEVTSRSMAMARAFGLPITRFAGKPGSAAIVAQMEGKPAMLVELLYHGWIDPNSAEIGVRGMLNVLRHVGMVDGELESLPPTPIPLGVYEMKFIPCNVGGIFYPAKEAGDPLRKGEVVGLIRNLYGDITEEVISPEDGYVSVVLFLNKPNNQAINTGDYVCAYFVPSQL